MTDRVGSDLDIAATGHQLPRRTAGQALFVAGSGGFRTGTSTFVNARWDLPLGFGPVSSQNPAHFEWSPVRLLLGSVLVILLALDVFLAALDSVSTYPDAFVDGHAVSNSSALLAQALNIVDKAYGQPISFLGAADDDPSDSVPDECFFLRSPSGTFESEVSCGGALLASGCSQGCGGELDFLLVVPFRVVKTTVGYVGQLSARPVALEGKHVVSGDRFWRPDEGYDGTVTNYGNGSLSTRSQLSLGTRPYVTGGIAAGATVIAVLVLVSLMKSPRRPRQLARLQLVAADQAWSDLGRLAVAAPVVPPSPVLVTAPPRPRKAPELPRATILEDEPQALAVPPKLEAGSPSISTSPRVDVMGPVRYAGWAEVPSRARLVELAAYLATHRDRPVPAERLRTVLWPYDPAQGDVALARVHEQVSRLRRCLGPDQLPDAAGGYQLAGTVACDWAEFEALVEAGRTVPGAESMGFLQRALALVRGQPFQDVPAKAYSWAWDELLVPHMEAVISDVAHELSVRCLAGGRHGDATRAVRQGLLALPKDERLLGDGLEASAAGEGRAGLDRAWHVVQGALGPEAGSSPLFATYKVLRDAAKA